MIALIRGDGVFGIFAANHRTEIVWGGGAVVLVLLSMLPRVGRRSRAVRPPVARDRVRHEPVAQDELVTRRDAAVGEEPVARAEPVAPDRAGPLG